MWYKTIKKLKQGFKMRVAIQYTTARVKFYIKVGVWLWELAYVMSHTLPIKTTSDHCKHITQAWLADVLIRHTSMKHRLIDSMSKLMGKTAWKSTLAINVTCYLDPYSIFLVFMACSMMFRPAAHRFLILAILISRQEMDKICSARINSFYWDL